MRIVVGASIAAGFLVAITWLGCVGDDPQPSGVTPDPGVADGDFRGRCNNGRCLEGLECNQGVCLYPNYPDGGTPPGVTRDGGIDGAALPPCPRNDGGNPFAVACPGNVDGGTCVGGETCCVGRSAESCRASPAACSGLQEPLECDSPSACGSQPKCCLSTASPIVATAACPIVIDFDAFKSTRCDNACTNDSVKVCKIDDDCGTQRCHRVMVQLTAGDIELGVCL